MPKQEVLVLGATGLQGNAVAHALLQAGRGVRALTRNLADPAAESLRLRGARLSWTDLDDATQLEEAVAGVDAIFAVTTSTGHGGPAETRQGLAVVELARRHNVRHVIYSSAMAAAARTGIAQYDSKHEIEQYLRASGVPFTIVCPGFFFENLLGGSWLDHLRRGELPLQLEPRRSLQQIAVSDVARFVRLLVQRPAEFLGRRLCIASDETTAIEMAAALARVIGRRITVTKPAPDAQQAQPWTREAFAWLDAHPGCANVPLLRARYPEVNWHTLDGWARHQDWSVLDP